MRGLGPCSRLRPAGQYGGNAGYSDDASRFYRYDSMVANSRRLRIGDLVVVRDRDAAIGVAIVWDVLTQSGQKLLLRCPFCATTSIKVRSTKTPRYRCSQGDEFDVPTEALVKVDLFTVSYEESFLPVEGLSSSDLKALALRPNDQMSVEELDADGLTQRLLSQNHAFRPLLEIFYQGRTCVSEEEGPSGDLSSAFAPSLGDRRRKVLRSIYARQGQPSFRKALMRRYRGRCAVTGCSLAELLEAAHIWPYRGEADNHAENGILLRPDIHTMFDLDLLGINPRTLTVAVHPSVTAAGYDDLDGRQLHFDAGAVPSKLALEARWKAFQLRMKQAANLAELQGSD